SFDAFVSDKHSCGIAIDNCAALIVEDSICKVLGTAPDSAVHILDASEGTLKKRAVGSLETFSLSVISN
ncbi:MAG: hypothetical protein RSB78_00900, partial [Oscillospiraceae bacterium]